MGLAGYCCSLCDWVDPDSCILAQGRFGDCANQRKTPLMIRIVVLLMTLLASCAAPTAPPNPNSVPSVLQSLTQARATPGALYVTGGIYDGAAAGQTARFVVTPQDTLICTFQIDPVGDTVGNPTVTAHRQTQPGLYATITAGVLPNVAPIEVEYTTNFTIEHQGPGGLTITQTGFGDQRFDNLLAMFTSFPSPCWTFG